MQRTETDERANRIAEAFGRAVEAAAQFIGSTSPNPPVGCAILDADGQILTVAAHQRAGEPHAEALAIKACREAGLADRIHTVVVTLEPCNHLGRTPPCSEAILGTPAREIWIGARDPNPRVKGGGAARLADAGLKVAYVQDLPHRDAQRFSESAQALLAPFAKHAATGLPWVTVKQAIDRNGSMIPPKGQKTFTSQDSLVLAHRLRKRADAILTGSGTVLADDPAFTVRHVTDFAQKKRHLVIADRRKRVSDAYMEERRRKGFIVSQTESIEDALQLLGRAGALEVLVEAGPTLTGEVLARDLWDSHVLIAQGQTGDGVDQVTIFHRQNQTYLG